MADVIESTAFEKNNNVTSTGSNIPPQVPTTPKATVEQRQQLKYRSLC